MSDGPDPDGGCPAGAEVPDQEHGIPRYHVQELCRELAAGDVKRADLARKYYVSRSAITQFARRHRQRIEDLKSKLDDDFAGSWIAQKRRRIEALQADFELSASGEYASHYEQIRVRTQILRAVADELGEIPTKSTILVGGVVRHELVGIDVDECFPVVPDTVPDALTSVS